MNAQDPKPRLQDLKNVLIDDCEYTPEMVEDMRRYEMIDRYLKYFGIIGYTDDIIEQLSNATGVNLRKKLGE